MRQWKLIESLILLIAILIASGLALLCFAGLLIFVFGFFDRFSLDSGMVFVLFLSVSGIIGYAGLLNVAIKDLSRNNFTTLISLTFGVFSNVLAIIFPLNNPILYGLFFRVEGGCFPFIMFVFLNSVAIYYIFKITRILIQEKRKVDS